MALSFSGFNPWLASFMAQTAWQSKAIHIAVRKQRGKGKAGDKNTLFQVTFPVTSNSPLSHKLIKGLIHC